MTSQQRLERIGLAIAILIVIGLIVLVFRMVLTSDQGPLEPMPTPEPTTLNLATPVATRATPLPTFDPDPVSPPGSLLHMLGYAPDRLGDGSIPLNEIADYADIQRWMASQGIATPIDSSDPNWDIWIAGLEPLAIPEVLATRGNDASWRATYGFGLVDVYQVLAVGSAPDLVLVLRGNFDADVLQSAWAESGYQAVRVDGVTYWSLNPAGSLDLSAPASRPALGNMNNLVLLEDGTLIATARSTRLEQTLSTVNGTKSSMADNTDILTLLPSGAHPDQIVTASILRGSVLETPAVPPTAVAVATPITPVSKVGLLLTGLSIADSGSPVFVIIATYDSVEDATMAYTRAQQEIATGQSSVTGLPYSDRLTVASMRVLASRDQESLLIIEGVPLRGWEDWLQMTEERDFGYLMWPREP